MNSKTPQPESSPRPVMVTREGAVATPPPLPPQRVGKWQDSRQFPRCLLFPFTRSAAAASDRAWFGRQPLRKHVVICGFPRSGTTLLQAMFEGCATGFRTFGRERRADECALNASRNHPFMMTKRPSDIFLLDQVREFYADRAADVVIIAMYRDPRAVLTSRHRDRPDRYYVPVERWRAIHAHWRYAVQFDDVMPLSYEELVADPNRVQAQLEKFVGFSCSRPFSEFSEALPRGFHTAALNGVRRVEGARVAGWREEKHRDRIARLVNDEMPELGKRVMDLGYETDERWVEDYLTTDPSFETITPRRRIA